MTTTRRRKNPPEPSSEATKLHILMAGRELLLAAQGALAFCKHYVETSSQERKNPELIRFFSRALDVANDLGRDVTSAEGLKRVADMVLRPVAAVVEKEMHTKRRKGKKS